ncbi:hypothetical protein [Kineosporia babensis]|uniref:Uncharacterized protein n=1 Tax=Kineosporia babensis TaxID=499548 RepID=A0A9X1NBU5_9ACTN|nr:hypothetical protein [Kineosporia babensis]MCD5310849.1 hypothetical protein [Kineosporia babensis]
MITPGGVVLLALFAWMLYTGRRVIAGLILGIFLGSTKTGNSLMGTVNEVCASLAEAISSIWDSVVQ